MMVMTHSIRRLALFALAFLVLGAAETWAQPVGTFRWRTEPYCDIVTLAVSNNGGVFTLDGFDEPCGNHPRLPVHGVAVPQADGSITLGLSILNVPDGTPVNLEARVTLPGVSGTWRDTVGNTGALTFNPAGASGDPRPLTAPTAVYARFRQEADLPDTSDDYGDFNFGREAIVTLPLPAGFFHIQAKAFANGTAGNVGCVLVAGPNVDGSLVTLPANFSVETLSLQVLNYFSSPGNAELRCTDYGEGARGLFWIKVHATQVTSILNLPAP